MAEGGSSVVISPPVIPRNISTPLESKSLHPLGNMSAPPVSAASGYFYRFVRRVESNSYLALQWSAIFPTRSHMGRAWYGDSGLGLVLRKQVEATAGFSTLGPKRGKLAAAVRGRQCAETIGQHLQDYLHAASSPRMTRYDARIASLVDQLTAAL